ncbi:MAG: amino acid ABC transporter permease [Erysipelotrichaceae bacterium]
MEYLFNSENLMYFAKGAGYSLLIAICSLSLGLFLSILITMMKMSKSKILKVISTLYVEIIRGTPMLLQLSFFYLVIPFIYQSITGSYLDVNPLLMGILAISLNSSAYLSEQIRGSIMAIDKGQWEGGKSIGLSYAQIMKKIILPQALKNMIPPIINEFIVLIKDSSLVSTIGVYELLKTAQIIGANNSSYFAPIMVAGCVYLTLTIIVSLIGRAVERKLGND